MIHNFYAGPSIISAALLEEAATQIISRDELLSVIEISHRSKRFGDIVDELHHLTRELLALNDDHEVCYLQGGGRQQFFQIPQNFSQVFKTNYYVDTGNWANGAMKEARFFGNTEELASSKENGYRHIPNWKDDPEDAAYIYTCTNNTIYGTQFFETPKTNSHLVADMSSDLFGISRDFNAYGLFYAATQKNAGTAGACLVVVDKKMFNKPEGSVPTMIDYRTHINKKSLYNTPPVFAFVMSLLVLKWIKEKGGITYFDAANREKASLLYGELERNELFEPYANKEDRSVMNAVFTAKNEQIEKHFLDRAAKENIVGIKGHRNIGGFRASMYNALPIESVQVLVDVMQEFERTQG